MKGERYAFILTTNGKYWEKFCQHSSGNEEIHAFVRKGQVGPTTAKKLIFYVTKPVMQIRGIANFIERLKGDRNEMWKKYGKETCFESENEYNAFVQGRDKVTFVRFQNFVKLENPADAEKIRKTLGSLRGFRGKYVNSHVANNLTLDETSNRTDELV